MNGKNNKSILLVEDDYLNRRLTKKVLADSGYEVVDTKNISEALQELEAKSFDMAIIDINLGENQPNGIVLGDLIQEKYNFPFVYLTAYESQEIISSAVSTNPYSYITKPFKKIDLITSVEIAIRKSKPIIIPKISVRDGEFNVELSVKEINYIESDGNYLLIHTDQKIYKMRSTIKQVLEFLPKDAFIQVHRAYVVNKNKIEKYDNKSLVVNNTIIPYTKEVYFKN